MQSNNVAAPPLLTHSGVTEVIFYHTGLINRIMAFFGLGISREQIRELVNKVMDENSSSRERLTSFNELRALALGDKQDQFAVKFDIDQKEGGWSYQFQIDDIVLGQKKSFFLHPNNEESFFVFFDECYPEDKKLSDALKQAHTHLTEEVDICKMALLLADCNQEGDIGAKFQRIAEALPGLDCGIEINPLTDSYTFTIATADTSFSGEQQSHPIYSMTQSLRKEDLITLWITKIKLGIERGLRYYQKAYSKLEEENLIEEIIGVEAKKQGEDLKSKLDDPLYNSKALKEVRRYGRNEAQLMIAEFDQGNFIFDGRAPDKSEFRGENLVRYLRENEYDNLRQLIHQWMIQTRKDGAFVGCLSEEKINFEDGKNFMTDDEFNTIKTALASIKVGHKTLDEVWNMGEDYLSRSIRSIMDGFYKVDVEVKKPEDLSASVRNVVDGFIPIEHFVGEDQN